MKDKKGKTVLNPFVEVVNESNCKPHKLWVDQERDDILIIILKIMIF